MSSDGKQIFGRAYRVVVAPANEGGALGAIQSTMGLDVSNLRCAFKVKKSLKPLPNTAHLKIFNLSRESRAVLENSDKLVLRLEAGYVDTAMSQLFLGEVRRAATVWDDGGVTSVTTIETGDSEKEMRKSRLHMSIGANTPVEVVLTAICRALGVGVGNLDEGVALLKTKGVATMFGAGSAISGQVAEELTEFCRSTGLEWSVQDGNLQILDRNKPLTDLAVELSAETGLVGSPSVDEKGVVSAKAFLIPELTPGRKVTFKSRTVTGSYKIDEVEYLGDSHGGDWYASLLCSTY